MKNYTKGCCWCGVAAWGGQGQNLDRARADGLHGLNVTGCRNYSLNHDLRQCCKAVSTLKAWVLIVNFFYVKGLPFGAFISHAFTFEHFNIT